MCRHVGEVAVDVLLDLLQRSDSRLKLLGALVDRADLPRSDMTVVSLAYLCAREAQRLGYSGKAFVELAALAWSRVEGEPVAKDDDPLRG